MRSSNYGIKKSQTSVAKSMVLSTDPMTPGMEPIMSLKNFGLDVDSMMQMRQEGARIDAAIGNAERPSNLVYKVTSQSTYWYMYALMDWYKTEVSCFSTIIQRASTELTKDGLEFKPKFVLKCEDCGRMIKSMMKKCPQCHSKRLRKPDWSQLEYFKNPHSGLSFLDDANRNHQMLIDVMKAYAELQYQDNQAYTVCITGDIYDKEDGHLIRGYPLEFIVYDPKFVKYLYDDRGVPGTRYAFTSDDRSILIDMEDPENPRTYDEEGMELRPASWQIGESYGGSGPYLLYADNEVYQDHWFSQSLIYGIPSGFDIEDDLLTWHYIEKHNLKKYEFGYVRKIIILPGCNEQNAQEIVKGIQDILARNDNSIPLVCLPQQGPYTPELQAQTLELGTESSEDLLNVKGEALNRICAHWGVPNMIMGDVEQSGGMNNESQQITIFDRFLKDKYMRLDHQCKWIMSFFPKITDFDLVICRPSKAYTDAKRFLDEIQKAQMMKGMGFDVYYRDGAFEYSEEPIDQMQRQMQMEGMGGMPMMPPGGVPPEEDDDYRGILPGDGDGPPEKGTARREDSDIDDTKNEIEQTKREADDAMED